MHPVNPPEDEPVDPLDERISAAIDGFGVDADGAADPVDAARARALTAARDAIATAPVPLDELTRRRLVNRALVEAPGNHRSRDPQRWSAVAGVAAVVTVIALGVWGLSALGHGSSRSDKASAGAAGVAGTTLAPAAAVNLGDVSQPAHLLAVVRAALAGSAPPASTASTAASNRAAGGATACLGTLRVPDGYTKSPLGSASFHGTAAVVIVTRDGSHTLIDVLARSDCRLLSAQFLRR